MTVLISLAVVFVIPSCFGRSFPNFPIVPEHSVQEQTLHLEGVEDATLQDLKYRLDLVSCPAAVPVTQSAVTYKTYIYDSIWKASFVCCSWQRSIRSLQMGDNREVTFEINGYEKGVIQHFDFSCPTGGKIVGLDVNLPPPVQFRGKEVCVDYVSLVFEDEQSYICEFCGRNFTADVKSCYETKTNRILATFRSGYHSNPTESKGFNITFRCSPSAVADQIQPQKDCIGYDPVMTSKEYMKNLKIGTKVDEYDLEAYLQNSLKKVPLDAKETLKRLQFDTTTPLTDEPVLRTLNMAILCEQSCDEELVALSSQVQAFFPEETLIRAKLYQ